MLIRNNKLYILEIIVMVLILLLVTFFFKDENIVHVTSIIVLIVFFLLLKEETYEKIKYVIPLILVLIVTLSPNIISLFQEEPHTKVYLTRYNTLSSGTYTLPVNLWNMYLMYNPLLDYDFLLTIFSLNTSDPNENVFFAGSDFIENLRCLDKCNIYYIEIINDGNVPIKKLILDGSIFTNNLEFFGVDPKIKISDNTGSYGHGGFHLEIGDLKPKDHYKMSIKADGFYNFTLYCQIEGKCDLSIYDAEIAPIGKNIRALDFLDERDNERKIIKLPRDSDEWKSFKLNKQKLIFEEFYMEQYSYIKQDQLY